MPVDTNAPLDEMTRDDLLAVGWRLGVDVNTMIRCDTHNLRILIEEERRKASEQEAD